MDKVRIIQIVKSGKLINPEKITMVGYIASHMREADVKECEPQGITPEEAIIESVLASEECFIAYGNVPLCIYGVAITAEGTAIWALASKDVDKYHKELVRTGMAYIREKKEQFQTLYNYISLDNKKALNYIKHAGAVFGRTIKIGNTKFIKFEIGR